MKYRIYCIYKILSVSKRKSKKIIDKHCFISSLYTIFYSRNKEILIHTTSNRSTRQVFPFDNTRFENYMRDRAIHSSHSMLDDSSFPHNKTEGFPVLQLSGSAKSIPITMSVIFARHEKEPPSFSRKLAPLYSSALPSFGSRRTLEKFRAH